MFGSPTFAGKGFAQNNLFPPLFTIISNINGYLNILCGLELLILSPGMCLKYFCQNKYNHIKTDVPEKHVY